MLAPRMNAAYRAIVRAPWLVVAAIGAVTVVLGLGALRLRVDSSVTTLLPRGDPAKQRYDEVVARFGADEVDIIGVIADDVLAPATLEKIRLLTERAAAIPGVGSVISLTNVRDPIADVLNPAAAHSEDPGHAGRAGGAARAHQGQPALRRQSDRARQPRRRRERLSRRRRE